MVFLHDPTQGAQRPREGSRHAFVGPMLALLGALLGPIGCRGRQAPQPPPVAVKLLTVAQTPTESRLVYSGTVKAQTQVDLAFKVGGYVQSVGATSGHAEPAAPAIGERDASFARAPAKSPPSRRLLQAGDQVARGTLLAALRESDFKQRYSELAGMSAEARASLQKATLDYERAQTLFSQNAISKAEFDAAKTRYHAIAGTVQAAGARVQQAAIGVADAQLRAPFDGLILERRVEVGSLVAPGAPAFVLADTSSVKVQFGAPDSLHRALALGLPATVSTDALPGRLFDGVVTKIAAQADPKTRVFDVEVSVDNADGGLKVGMVASVAMGRPSGPASAAILIPLASVIHVTDPDGYGVYLADPQNLAHLRRVELGGLAGNRVTVAQGLEVGDRVVVQGATLLADGQRVNVIPLNGGGMGADTGPGEPRGRNLARYFTESRHVAWVLLVATLVFGAFAYVKMPKRKDPFIKVRVAVAVCPWPGAAPEKVEQFITRRIEEAVAQNPDVEKIESSSRTGVAVVTVTLRDELPEDQIGKAFDDIDLKLRAVRDLPPGSLPVEFQKDFGDTAALMLTVASPKARPLEIGLRARAVEEALRAARAGKAGERHAIVISFPGALDPAPLRRNFDAFARYAASTGAVHDVRVLQGAGFLAADAAVDGGGALWTTLVFRYLSEQLTSRFHPDIWHHAVVGDLAEVEARLRESAGDAYSARELDDFTQAIATRLRAVRSVAKVTRSGVLGERVYLDYAQERFAALEVTLQTMREAIASRNVVTPSGAVDADGRGVTIQSSGEYQSERDVANTLFTSPSGGHPVHVGDVVDVVRDYEPPLYQNFYTTRGAAGGWERTRAVTLAVQMRPGEQIAAFSQDVDRALAGVRQTLPEDLVVARTSDQPRQVEQKVGLFMKSLYEAVIIIILVGFVGFREWRSALVLALSIPLALAMTFVFMWVLRIDVQQISIAALILALGLLVDDPVVAGDAIRHELDRGVPRQTAAWLGPTKLAHAILYATITNIVAYLPFLLMTGAVGSFIYSLPIVLTCSLVASRIVSMTFIPLLGYVLLRPKPREAAGGRFMAGYRAAIAWAIARRKPVLAGSLAVLALGGLAGSRLRSSFFPKDHSHLFYVDLTLPEDATIRATGDAAQLADEVVRDVAARYGADRHEGKGEAAPILRSVTTFVGGGAPRFWYSLAPQQRQLNYAQLVVEVVDEHDTAGLIDPIQTALTSRVPGARTDVRQLENGKPVLRPVEVRVSGDDVATLRALSRELARIFRGLPSADRVRDDWGENSFRLKVDVDPERASQAGVTNADVSNASAAGFSGVPLGVLREGERQIPIVGRLRAEERGNASELEELYVLSPRGAKVPLSQVARVSLTYEPERIQRLNQIRTVAVSCFPAPGFLPSEVMNAARKSLAAFAETLPPGYQLEVGGTEENVLRVRKEAALVAVVSLVAILLALVLQFRHALKPLIVFATIPYGVSGALASIVVMGSPFGFTAILGVISLIGVIVSHVIVLFDYIEEAHERGEPFEAALLNAGTQRLRPVFITVGATVLGLVPLALHGGPLWEPLCYAQIGGLTLATGITLFLVPVLYAVVVLDLKWLTWDVKPAAAVGPPPPSVRTAILQPRPGQGPGPWGQHRPPPFQEVTRTVVLRPQSTPPQPQAAAGLNGLTPPPNGRPLPGGFDEDDGVRTKIYQRPK